jgi:hypothetical protein
MLKLSQLKNPDVIISRKLTTERQYKRTRKTGQAIIYKTELKPGGELEGTRVPGENYRAAAS